MFAVSALVTKLVGTSAVDAVGDVSNVEDDAVPSSEEGIVVYTMNGCLGCMRTKELLNKIGAPFTEESIHSLSEASLHILAVAAGSSLKELTMPQVFIGGALIGGYDTIAAAQLSGELYGILGSAMVQLSGEQPELSSEQQLAARKAMVPAPYVEVGFRRSTQASPRMPLHAGRSTRTAPPGGSRFFFQNADVRSILIPVLLPHFKDAATGTFKLRYTEKNKSYLNKPDDSKLRLRDQESTVSERTAIAELTGLNPDTNAFDMHLSLEQTNMWGINFVGTVEVTHPTGESCTIYLPGVLTFDPAGITGDSHASERIGPSCARIQTAVTFAELYALQKGGNGADVDTLQKASGELIYWYNGRLGQWKWMRQQVKEACEEKKSKVTPYPTFLQQMSDSGELDMTHENRAMTKEYLETFAKGDAVPPMAYFIKVNEKGCSCFASPDAEKAGEGATCGDEDATCGDGDEGATCGDGGAGATSAGSASGAAAASGAGSKQAASKGAKYVDNMEEFDALTAQGPVIIDFTATWCGPCKMIGPYFEALSNEDANAGIVFIKVDVDDAEDVSEKCGISAMPTFQVWQGGQKVDSLVGASKEKLAALVAKFV